GFELVVKIDDIVKIILRFCNIAYGWRCLHNQSRRRCAIGNFKPNFQQFVFCSIIGVLGLFFDYMRPAEKCQLSNTAKRLFHALLVLLDMTSKLTATRLVDLYTKVWL